MDLDWTTDCAGADGVSVVVEPQSSCACASCVSLLAWRVFDTEACCAWNPSKQPR
jgi:hypothetical protein